MAYSYDQSFALAPSGKPHVLYELYLPSFEFALRYASQPCPTCEWRHVTIPAGGSFPSVQCDAAGQPWASVYTGNWIGYGGLATGWTFEHIDGGFTGSNSGMPSLALAADGSPRIAYMIFMSPLWEVRYAWKDLARSGLPAPAEALPAAAEALVMPTPLTASFGSRASMRVVMDLPRTVGALRVDVLDMAGRHVTTLHQGAAPRGPLTLEWNASAASTGVYTVHAVGDGVSWSKRLIHPR